MASKKKGLSLKLLLSACAALLAVVTLILLVAPGMSPKNDIAENISLSVMAFGNKDKLLAFSFLVLLPYILLLAGIVLNIVSLLGKGGKLLPFIAAVCYVGAAVLFFIVMQTYCVYVPEALKDEARELYIKTIKKGFEETYTLGLGAIFSGVLSALCAVFSAVSVFVKK
jgi:hypothetical protein